MERWANSVLARYQEFVDRNPDVRCPRCELVLSKHTAKEFIDCELVLAAAGKETLLVNRPNG